MDELTASSGSKGGVRVPVPVMAVLVLIIVVLASIQILPLLTQPGDDSGGEDGGISANNCAEKYINEFRCSSTSSNVERQFQYANCTVIWKSFQYCPDGCSGGACL